MTAIILAAGYAQRLHPLTENKSKALLGLAGKPIISHIVESLHKIDDVDEIFVVTNDKFYRDFVIWQGIEQFSNVEIINDGTTGEDNKLGAIGDIDFVIRQKNIDDDLFIVAGDSFFTFELRDFYEFYLTVGSDSVCVAELEDIELLRRFATAITNEQGIISELVEKAPEPKSNLGVYAIYIYQKDSVRKFSEYLSTGNSHDAPGYFLQWIYDKKDVYAYKISGEILDIGTLASYKEAQERFGE